VKVFDAMGDSTSWFATVKVKDNCEDPVASIDVPASDMTIGLGQTVAFEGSATGGDPPYEYNWTMGPSGPAGNPAQQAEGESTSFNFDEEGRFTVRFHVYDVARDHDVDAVEITVISDSGFDVQIESPEDNETFGVGDKVKFSPTVTGGIPPYTYRWSFSAGSGVGDSTAQSPEVKFNFAGTFEAVVEVTDSEGRMILDVVTINIDEIRSVPNPSGRAGDIVSAPAGFERSPVPGSLKLIVGYDGIATFDPETLTSGDVFLAGNQLFSATFATPTGGERTVFMRNFSGMYTSTWDPGTMTYGDPVSIDGSPRGEDMRMIGDDPTSDAVLITTYSAFELHRYNAVSGAFERTQVFPDDLFPNNSGSNASALMLRDGDGFLAVIGESPSQLYYHDGIEGNDATYIGALGDTPMRIAYLDGIAVVPNRRGDSATIISWDGGSNAAVLETVAVGNSPRYADLMLLPNGNIAGLITCQNDNSFTVMEITPGGTVLSNRLVSGTFSCGSPTVAAWLDDGTTDFVGACQSDGNLIVIDSGL